MISPPQNLREDKRGAIMVAGTFMAAFTVGALWYIIGVGDAAVYHEAMQDSVDATSFASSVFQARGMNLVSLLNLVMAAILAILVAAKILQMLLLIANVAACAAGGYYNYYCDLLSGWESPYSEMVDDISTAVTNIDKVLYATESTVAVAMPIVAEVKSIAQAGQYKPMVNGGFAINLSIIPGALEQAFKEKLVDHQADDPGNGISHMRWGLPVQDDDYSNLCAHAALFVVDIVFKAVPNALPIVAPIKQYAGDMVEVIAKAAPTYFCGGNGSLNGGAGGAIGGALQNAGQTAAKAACQQAAQAAAASRAHGLPGTQNFNEADCEKGIQAGASSVLGGSGGGGSSSTPNASSNVSKKMYLPVWHGDDYFASWGFVYSNFMKSNTAQKGVNIAAWGKTPPPANTSAWSQDIQEIAQLMNQVQFSKSEFYYDPRQDGPTAWQGNIVESALGIGGGVKDEANWNMRWRARLRRVRLPSANLGSFFTGAALSELKNVIGSRLGDNLMSNAIFTMIGVPAQELGKWVDQNIVKTESEATGGIIH